MTQEELNKLPDRDLAVVALREIVIGVVAEDASGISGVKGEDFIEACAKLYSLGNPHGGTTRLEK